MYALSIQLKRITSELLFTMTQITVDGNSKTQFFIRFRIGLVRLVHRSTVFFVFYIVK